MINQNALAAKVLEILSNHDLQADAKIAEIEAILRTPKRPTLADMAEEARDSCQWMQCDVTGFQGQLVLATPYDDDGDAGLISACGEMTWSSPNHVTPRPDLPRLEWPVNQEAAPATTLPGRWRFADHPEHGRVLVVRIFGDKAIYATPDEMLGIHTHVSLVSDLTFVDPDDQTTEEA